MVGQILLFSTVISENFYKYNNHTRVIKVKQINTSFVKLGLIVEALWLELEIYQI